MLRTGWTHDELLSCPQPEYEALVEWIVSDERVRRQQAQ